MADPEPPPNAEEIFRHLDEALQGLELEPSESAEILGFANREIPYLLSPETSYLILGSYRDPFIQRVRIVHNELDKRLGTYPFLLGDLTRIDVPRLPSFRVRFYLIAPYADYIVGVYEQDAGGEITELGKISSTPFFENSYVLPRDYAWMTSRKLESKEDVFTAAVNIYFNDDLDSDEIEVQLDELISEATSCGLDVDKGDIVGRIESREEADESAVSYSWVHLNEFRLFELHDKCFPWLTQDELRSRVAEIP